MNSASKNAVVVGSGIAGMTAAYRLKQAGFGVTVLEAGDQVGGRMSCRRIEGFTFNRASTALGGGYEFLSELITEVGLEDQLNYRDIKIGTFRDGKVYPIRTNHMMLDSFLSGSLSWRSKFLMSRVLADTKKAEKYLDFSDLGKAAPIDTESVKDYALRRLNQELLDYVADPAMAAVLGTTPERASVVDLLFSVSHFIGRGIFGFAGGIDFLVDALAKHVSVELNSQVTNVEETPSGVCVRWDREGAHEQMDCDACVIATSAHQVPKIYPTMPTKQADILNGYEYTSIINCQFGVDYDPDVDADYTQVPQCEIPGLIILLLPHRMSPGVAPKGKGIVTACSIDSWSKAHMHHSDEEIVAAMLPMVERIIPDMREHIEVTNVTRWPQALFASSPGVYTEMKNFRDSIFPNSPIQLAGDYFSFSSTNASAMSGDRAAHNIINAGKNR